MLVGNGNAVVFPEFADFIHAALKKVHIKMFEINMCVKELLNCVAAFSTPSGQQGLYIILI
jgi:hypothetical protein